MAIDETSEPGPRISQPPSLTVLPVPRETADTATSGDHTAKRELERRLAGLVENAITSRSIAKQYLRTARRFLAAARSMPRTDDEPYQAHLREACHARSQAHRCLSFARLCQRRADYLAAIGFREEKSRT